MTECERLLENGFISEDFLKEEIRDGYLVSAEMKKVWAIEMDLLREFISLCEQHHLQYWVDGGTLLGTIRHKGFIPWDDDLDVWMPREDYDKLLQIRPEEIPTPYFLQTPLNDEDYYCPFARLRNSNTTGILISKNNRCNNGIYIDIVPGDGLSKIRIIQKLRAVRIQANNIAATAYVFNVNPNILTRSIHKILHWPIFRYDPRRVFQKINRISSRIPWREAEQVGDVAFSFYPYDRLYHSKKYFETTIQKPFEHMMVNVPGGYDGLLSDLYGDYMTFPPAESQGTQHHFTFDPDHAYNQAIGSTQKKYHSKQDEAES